jgi:hypothetical protein
MDQVKGKWALITAALPDKSRIGIFSLPAFPHSLRKQFSAIPAPPPGLT